MTAHFSTCNNDRNDKLRPIVIWIATDPSSTTAENVHNVSPEILSPLKANGVKGAVIEWYEGVVQRL